MQDCPCFFVWGERITFIQDHPFSHPSLSLMFIYWILCPFTMIVWTGSCIVTVIDAGPPNKKKLMDFFFWFGKWVDEIFWEKMEIFTWERKRVDKQGLGKFENPSFKPSFQLKPLNLCETLAKTSCHHLTPQWNL